MLNPQAVAATAEPDGRSAPEVSLDARVRRCRVGTTGNLGRFRRQIGFLVLFEDGRQGYSSPDNVPASYLSGECRFEGRDVAEDLAALLLPQRSPVVTPYSP